MDALILAGGENKRFPVIKGFLEVDGKRVIESNIELLSKIIDKWEKEYDTLIPIFDDKPQPLLGIYSKRIAKRMEQSIKNGERSLRRFLQGINVLYINEDELREIDPEGRSFININTM